MLKFNIATEKDRKEAAHIERKRIEAEERKKRIFNPKLRLIGIDTKTLQSQVEEKKKREEEQKRIDKIFDDYLKQSDQLAVALEQKQQEELKKLQQEINNYRKYYQKPEDRREFDLNNPEALKNDIPARLNDDDPRLGPSSAQKFEGEDLASDQRLKVQKEQIQAWLNQQLIEKQLAENDRKKAEQLFKDTIIARDQRAIELDRIEQTCRKKLDEACTKYNLALADQKQQMENLKKQQSMEDNYAEIYNALTSDLLTENPDVSQSNMGPDRKIAFMYKGMSDEEKLKIREAQLKQIEEAKMKKELEKRKNQEFDEYLNGTQKSIYLMDLEIERKQKDERKKVAEENLRLAEEQKQRNRFMNKIVYANRANEEYFDQFNTSCR